MYSVSNCKIWVFAAKMVDEDDNGVVVKLIKCAVIDCSVPVFAISVSFGFLILGEENGVRVFPLRPLVKGRVKEHRRESKNLNDGLTKDKLEAQRLNLPNGVIQRVNGTDVSNSDSVLRVNYGASGRGSKRSGDEDTLEISSFVKLKSVKLRRDSKEGGSFFVAFKSKEVEGYKSTKVPLQSAKAISIQALSPNKFVILDSTGELQLLCLSNPVLVSEIRCHVKQLTTSMKVEKLAILPDISTIVTSKEDKGERKELLNAALMQYRVMGCHVGVQWSTWADVLSYLSGTQTVWISDGRHTVHMLAVPDIDASFCESDGKDIEEKLIQISVLQAIFASETIQDIIPLASNAILILGQVKLICIYNFLKVLGGCLSIAFYRLSTAVASEDTELLQRNNIRDQLGACWWSSESGARLDFSTIHASPRACFHKVTRNSWWMVNRLSGGVLNQRAPKGSQSPPVIVLAFPMICMRDQASWVGDVCARLAKMEHLCSLWILISKLRPHIDDSIGDHPIEFVLSDSWNCHGTPKHHEHVLELARL
ncbi:unnamed protein product [Camellia sinensis]